VKKTLFLATYFNNPHFIKIQAALFDKFIEDDYEFAVVDDSGDSTRSIVSNDLARSEIACECSNVGARHIMVPQSIHAHFRDGGYVPDPETYHAPDINHPSNRQQAVLRWLLANHKNMGLDQYKTLVLMDADIFIKKPMKISEYMDADFIGTGRRQFIDLPTDQPSRFFTDKVRSINKSHITFYNCCLLFINMCKVTNLETMDIGTWPGTDTGSKTNFFIRENPQYNFMFLSNLLGLETRIDVLSKNNEPWLEMDENLNPVRGDNHPSPSVVTSQAEFDYAEIIHYRAGSNWSYESPEFYKAKLNRLLKKYIPGLGFSFDDVDGSIVSRYGDVLS
jgi:hypothetical protein